MEIKNSKLLDPESFLFSVIDAVRVQLFSGYTWQGQDLTDPSAQGSVFYAFEEPPLISVASITVVDVSGDVEEPNIELLEQDGVEAVDSLLKNAIASQMNIVNWMSSKLNVLGETRTLVTPYVVKQGERELQYIAVRIPRYGRKYVVVGMFDVAKSKPLASLVFRAIQSTEFLSH